MNVYKLKNLTVIMGNPWESTRKLGRKVVSQSEDGCHHICMVPWIPACGASARGMCIISLPSI